MKVCKRFISIAVLFSAAACMDTLNHDGFYILNYWADFNESVDGWTGDFADYPATENDSTTFELKIEHTGLPGNIDGNKQALLVSGYNYSDDLFMFIKKKITGLRPSTEYTIVFSVELASNAPFGSVNGGKPGERVFLKVGAVSTEPKKVIESGFYRMNIDKGNHENSGEDMRVIGDIAVSTVTDSYTLITRSNSASNAPLMVRSNSRGELWLIIGTDSDYEGPTTIYYTGVNVVLSISK